MATVIERFGTNIEGGIITHDDRPSTYKTAEKIAGHKLDRRKNYAIINGLVAESCVWSQACSGCYEGYDSSTATGSGCGECGYTGRRRLGQWVPIESPKSGD
ncbi:MAG: hypothetical protein E6Q97_25525 [Desulfurellales bacterium]|nr:MAG: hypothetical protein E6Q97_25525 [Desulfurellales bacterium]